jgi:hypothetical protein
MRTVGRLLGLVLVGIVILLFLTLGLSGLLIRGSPTDRAWRTRRTSGTSRSAPRTSPPPVPPGGQTTVSLQDWLSVEPS